MMLTKLEALEKSLAMWEWMAETGSKDKYEYFDYLKSKGIDTGVIPMFCCYLCEYQNQRYPFFFVNSLCGKDCLVHWTDKCNKHCCDEGSPYGLWLNSPNHWRTYYAYQIVTKIKNAIKKIGGE